MECRCSIYGAPDYCDKKGIYHGAPDAAPVSSGDGTFEPPHEPTDDGFVPHEGETHTEPQGTTTYVPEEDTSVGPPPPAPVGSDGSDGSDPAPSDGGYEDGYNDGYSDGHADGTDGTDGRLDVVLEAPEVDGSGNPASEPDHCC